jgi:hypothetical protein
MNLSHLEKSYFISPWKYNCPFCKINGVNYELVKCFTFNKECDKLAYVYIIECNTCSQESIHFSQEDIRAKGQYNTPLNYFDSNIKSIDDKIFLSFPESFFTIDSRVPRNLRNLIFEAEKCRQANALVGSSACIRKSIYELLLSQNAIITDDTSNKSNYKESIKSLKKILPFVTEELFDILSQIQELSSEHIHEGSWESWDSKTIKMLIELMKQILNEIYVIPEEKKAGLKFVNELKTKINTDKKDINP